MSEQVDGLRMIEVSPKLESWIRAKRWTIHVCAEPDGQDCDSGTHPNILTHRCEAMKRWHEAMSTKTSPDDLITEKGPTVVLIEVKALPGEPVPE